MVMWPTSTGTAVPCPLLRGQCTGAAVQPILLLPPPPGSRLELHFTAECAQVSHAQLQTGGSRGNPLATIFSGITTCMQQLCCMYAFESVSLNCMGSGNPPATVYAQCITSLPLRNMWHRINCFFHINDGYHRDDLYCGACTYTLWLPSFTIYIQVADNPVPHCDIMLKVGQVMWLPCDQVKSISANPRIICVSLFKCFFYHLNHGLRSGGGIGEWNHVIVCKAFIACLL